MPDARKLPRLNGSWEKAGRNPAIASLIIVLVLGSIYFMAGNIVSIGLILARALDAAAKGGVSHFTGGFGGSPAGGDWLERLRKSYEENRTWILGLTDACQFLFFLLAGSMIVRAWFSSDLAEYARYKRPPVQAILAGIVGAVLILPVVDAISWAVDSLFPGFTKFNEVAAALYQWKSPLEAVFVFFSISITPAICEEFIFRGVFQRGLQRRLAFPWSFIWSGTVFAIFHQSPLATPALIPVGVMLGFLYWAFDSIWAGMAMHATYNGIILLLTNKALPLPSIMANGNYLRWPAWLIGACGLAVLCYFIGKRGLARKGREARDDGLPADPTAVDTTA